MVMLRKSKARCRQEIGSNGVAMISGVWHSKGTAMNRMVLLKFILCVLKSYANIIL